MAPELEEKQTFDGEKAALLVKELRKSFNSGKTKSYEWRISQLEAIAKMLEEKEKEIIEALDKDLSKPGLEAFISEVSTFLICLFASYVSFNYCFKENYFHLVLFFFPFPFVMMALNIFICLIITSVSALPSLCSPQIICPCLLVQVSQAKSSCSEALQELKHWMKPEKVID